MLRLSLECATLVIRGDDYAPILIAGAEKIMKVDAGVGLTCWRWADPASKEPAVTVEVSGVAPMNAEQLARASSVAPHHPSFSELNWSSPSIHRVSDRVSLPRFWDTDVWAEMHGHNNGRYPASVNFGYRAQSMVFLALHRSCSDFTDEDMEVLDLLHGPLAPALSFRQAWEQATRRLEQSLGTPPDRLTPREAQVVALVSRGWTNRRIGHILGITERTVRKHLENVNAKLGVSNRAAAATRWVQAGGQVPSAPR